MPPASAAGIEKATELLQTTLRNGITRSKEFERKGLAAYAINVGTKCGHACLYCDPTGAMALRRLRVSATRLPCDAHLGWRTDVGPGKIWIEKELQHPNGGVMGCASDA